MSLGRYDRTAGQKKEKVNGILKTNQPRKAVRIPLTGWEVDPQLEEEYGITQWCEWSNSKRRSKVSNRKHENGDTDCELFRRSINETCPSIDCCSLFQRESLHERFRKNCQFAGSYRQTSETKYNGDVEKEANAGSAKAKGSSPPEESKTPKRLCKSACSSSNSRAITTSPVPNGIVSNDNTASPLRSHSAQDQSESCADVQEGQENKSKVKKMAGGAQTVTQNVAQKYIQKGDTVTDEGEDENDEGYGSKISSNETEAEVGDSSRQCGVVKHEDGLVKSEDGGRISQSESTFRWIRENDQSRIVKLTYSQKDKSIYGATADGVVSNRNTTEEPNSQPSGRGVRGIMAASLSNLSPGTMHFHHLRNPNNVAYLNLVDSPRWGYENNSNGQFLPNREQKVADNTPEIKPTAIVLRKVTIQNCNKNEQDSVCSDSKNDETLRDSMSCRERTKFTLHRTSPQLIVDSTKLPRNVSIPSSKHYSYNNDSSSNSVVNQLEDQRTPGSSTVGDSDEILNQLIISDRSTPGYFPIGELLPAMERSMRQRSDTYLHKSASSVSFTFSSKENKHPFLDSRSLGGSEEAMISKQDVDIIHASYTPTHGPPAFRPLYTRSPLQRAREIATRRLHGHITQQPDGSSTIRVSSPRFGFRHDTRSFLRQDHTGRMSSAERPTRLAQGLLGFVSKHQHKSMSARSRTSQQTCKRPIQGKCVIYEL